MTAFNDTFGIIGFSSENVGIDRRIYTGLTSTNPQLNVSYNGGRVDVYLNGVKLMGNHSGQNNYDYTYQGTGSGSAITLSTGVALVATDTIECIGYVSNSSNTVTTYTPSVSAGNNTFTSISHTSSDLLNVFLNGVLLDPSDYTADANADTVTITSLASGDVVHIQVIGALDHSNFVPESGGTFSGNVAYTGNIQVDDIIEKSADHGVEIDGVTLKDGSGTFSSTAGAGITVKDSDDKPNGWELRANGTRFQIGEAGVADRFAIKAGGYTGIGTVDPSSKLEISGGDNGASSITLKNTAPNPDAHWQITPSYASDTLQFRSANNSYAARLEVYAGGGIGVNGGNLVIGTTGKGIDFSNASGSHAGATGSVLDDYEEGNIQSFFEVAGSAVTVTSFSEKTAVYVKIGNVCHVFYRINTGGVNIGSGDMTLILPFNSSSDNFSQGRYIASASGSLQYNWWFRIQNNTDTIELFSGTNTSGTFTASTTNQRSVLLYATYKTV